jgi:penicillin-binding protein 2
MGYRLGIQRLDEYASAFGLGSKTGIEIGDYAGILAGPEHSESVGQIWYGGNTVMAAIGQSDNLFTPLQLANYIATLVDGGDHYAAHLLKTVKSYDNSSVIYTGVPDPLNCIDIKPENLTAVKNGMHDLTTTGGLSSYFRSCVVDAGAKTGTAQVTKETKNNGVFVCFAPFDDPEIAVAIVIEKGGSGAALASTAVKILNAYFTKEEIGTVILGEDQMLP